ncbi:helix-turn-helix transcriptional regulator [Inquilinus sp. NPDC058860]|uniref:helix-turn-helix transcriptional regulator n=1 Tax=Inquilinus sp. NPDC058860 TaxID=3346652 RepID=UPI0036AA8383
MAIHPKFRLFHDLETQNSNALRADARGPSPCLSRSASRRRPYCCAKHGNVLLKIQTLCDEGFMKFQSMEQYSELIGSIYDCTIDPTLWPDTIATICGVTDCMAGAIRVSDLENSRLHLVQTWNYDPATLSDMSGHAAGIAAFWAAVPNLRSRPLDEPASVRRELPHDVVENSRYNIEWARPRGIIDVLALLLLREPTRLGDFTLSRHKSSGPVTDDNLGTMRLLAPHIRRAVTIGDLMDMKTLEAQVLRATLDTVTTGVVVVGAKARILHANDAARRMIEARSPVVSLRGCLAALHPEANRELARAIALARSDEAGIGAAGIGVPLLRDGMAAATAHVLPLARGDLRTRLVPQAVAAVFIVAAGTPLPADLDTVARLFGLTAAEARLLRRLTAGETIAEASAALGVSQATMRTHCQHLYAKIGVSRRSELVTLVNRLTPSAHRPPPQGG